MPAVGDALEMDHFRGRLVIDFPPRLAYPKCEIGILAVGRRITFVEPAEPFEQRPLDQQRRAGTIVGFAQIVVLRLARLVVAAEIPSRTVAPQNAAGFLQSA